MSRAPLPASGAKVNVSVYGLQLIIDCGQMHASSYSPSNICVVHVYVYVRVLVHMRAWAHIGPSPQVVQHAPQPKAWIHIQLCP